MDNIKLLKLSGIISILISLMIMILTNMFSTIPDSFYSQFGTKIGYKALLQVPLLLFLALLIPIFFLIFKNRYLSELSKQNIESNSKTDIPNKISKKQKIKYLKNLNFEERKILRLFVDQNTTTIKISDISLVHTLSNLAKIQIVYPQFSVTVPQPFTIDPDVWDYLLKHKDLLKINNG